MSQTTQALRLITAHNTGQPLPLLEAAKATVALSGWSESGTGERLFVVSAIAIEALRQSIVEVENPQLRLAPEPLPFGL